MWRLMPVRSRSVPNFPRLWLLLLLSGSVLALGRWPLGPAHRGGARVFAGPNRADPTSDAAAHAHFHERVAPLLTARCLGCHAGKTPAGGLSLEDARQLHDQREAGQVVHPGDWASSLLWEVIGGTGEPPRMPKQGPPLTAAELETLKQWLVAGAPWPAETRLTISERDSTWWSLRPLSEQRDAWFDATGWARNRIDAAIRERAGPDLGPAPEASREVLIRRLTFDLTGLPPTPEEVAEFTADDDPQAYVKLVERLLASPAHGERRARQWLDVAHFGESDDFGRDYLRPNAWPYRDWVIGAWNADLPLDRFVALQIAGDALDPDDPQGVTATGFLAGGPWDYTGHVLLFDDSSEKEATRYLDRDDMLGSTFSSFASLTVQCARCHDHKFDPISQAEYYALQAVFAGSNRADRPRDARVQYDPATRWWLLPSVCSLLASVLMAGVVGLVRKWPRRLLRGSAWLLGTLSLLAVATVWGVWLTDLRDLPRRVENRLQSTLGLSRPLRFDPVYEGAPKVYAVASVFPRLETKTGSYAPAPGDRLRPVHLLRRGNVTQPGERAAPGALRAVAGCSGELSLAGPDSDATRRAALARWFIQPGNPLIWRTMANRVWQFHFGLGLVDTPNDFGRMGSPPTHPELLEELARELRDHHGSLKRLSREIVLSATYRQSAHPTVSYAEVDAGNRLLWAGPSRRLDAESLRDAMLACAGVLNRQMGGPGFRTFELASERADIMQYDYNAVDLNQPDRQRRSIYRFLARSEPDPFFEALDCPAPSQAVPLRSETNTALQALAMLNDRLVFDLSERFAQRILAEGPSPEQAVARAWELALQRPATPEELRPLLALAEVQGLPAVCRVLWNSNAFHFVD